MGSRSFRVAPLVFCSGFCALIYQMAWLREFRLFFGASTAATAAVLAVFMGGLGFGSAILGRLSEKKDRPLRFYATLELMIAGSAALTPGLVWLMRQIYLALGGTVTMGLGLATVVRLLMSAVVLGVPTFLMGGTLPAVVRAVVGQEDTNRRPVALLYGVNTLGAVMGTVMATFYFFETWGNRLTLSFAALFNIAVALAAFWIAKTLPTIESGETRGQKAEVSGRKSTAPPVFVYVASGVAGFAFLLMEIVWYRMLSPLLGGSTFTFGLILAVALLGIGLGGLLYVVWFVGRQITLSTFAVVCAVEAFCVAFPYALGDRVALITMLLRPLGVLGFYGFVAGWVAICAIVVLPAAIISGVQFPMLIALLGKGRTRVGSQTGMAYAWNTAGAIAGSLAGGFGFLPAFSAPGVWKLVVVLLSVLAMVAAVIDLRRLNLFRLIASLGSAAVALWLLTATGPTAFWRHSEIGVGRLSKLSGPKTEFHDLMNAIRRDILWEKDGVESSVALSKRNNLNFIVNGKCDGGLKVDAGTQIMAGLIVAALHPRPARVLVVGLGTGSTAGWLAAVPSVQRVDVFELEPAILKVAEQCAPMNHNALANPKVHVTIGDARELLLVGRDKYDLIVSEPSNPYRAGIASLFTREYYQAAAKKLNPSGLFAQWVQAYEIDDRTIQTVYATFGSVFPYIETWQTEQGDLLLVGTTDPRTYDADELRKRIGQEPFQTALRQAWHVTSLEGFLAHFIADHSIADRLQHLQPLPPLNTDDRTVLEYAFARNVDRQNGFRLSAFRLMAGVMRANRLPISSGEISWPNVDADRLSMLLGFGEPPNPAEYASEALQSSAAAYANYLKGDLPRALQYWRMHRREPLDLNELLMVAECTANQADPEADAYIEQLRKFMPNEADAILVSLLWHQGKREEATDLLEKVLQRLHSDPWLSLAVTARTLALAEQIGTQSSSEATVMRLYDTLRKPFCVYDGDNARLADLLLLGVRLDKGHYGKYTLAAVEQVEPFVLWQPTFLRIRAACYKAVGSPRFAQAERDLNEFMAEQPVHLDVVPSQRNVAPAGAPGTAMPAAPR